MSAGKLLQSARKDLKKILTGGSGFEDDVFITDTTSGQNFSIKGIHPKHSISFDSDGNPINSKSATVNIMESDLLLNGVKTRNDNTGNVDLYHLLIDIADASGVVKNYKVNETFPSETFGCIIIVLGDFRKI